MADPLPVAGRGRSDDPSHGVAGVLTFLTVALIVAALYFAREVLVPLALAILLSFLLMPAVRLLRRLRAGRVTSVAITVLVAFLAIFAFGAIVAQEISLLGPELPKYQHNIESKLRAVPKAIPLERVAGALHQVTATLKRSQATGTAPTAQSPGSPTAEPVKPLPVEIEQPELTPLQIAETVIGPFLQPLATAGLVIVLVVFSCSSAKCCAIACCSWPAVATCTGPRGDERSGAAGQQLSDLAAARSMPLKAS